MARRTVLLANPSGTRLNAVASLPVPTLLDADFCSMGRNSKWIECSPDDCTSADCRARAMAIAVGADWHYSIARAAQSAERDRKRAPVAGLRPPRGGGAGDLRDWLPARRGRWVNKQVKRVRKAAGDARDLDVLRLGWIERGGKWTTSRWRYCSTRWTQSRGGRKNRSRASHEKLIGKGFERA